MTTTTHQKCGKSWNGYKPEHCAVCCETFTGTEAGDMHRIGDHNDGTRRCMTVDEMLDAGLVRDTRGMWRRDRGDRPNRWAVEP